LTPSSTTGYATEGSSAGMSYTSDHHHGPLSPRSISGSTTSTAYSNIPARVVSPHDPRPMGLQGGPPGLRVAVPGHDAHWQGAQQHHMQTSQQYLSNNTSARNSWEMSNYLDHSPATAGGTSNSSQNLNYSTSRNGTDSAAPGGDSRISRTMPLQGQQIPRS
jgi:hypothetical protein